jgi:hypothetical protein
MPAMTAAEEAHVKKVGRKRFDRAFDYAEFETRRDSHFVGLDKLRRAIAYEAALRATGFADRPLKLPRAAGPGEVETQQIAESILERATTLACRALEVLP